MRKVTINAVQMTYCNHRIAVAVHSETKLHAPNSFQLFGTLMTWTVHVLDPTVCMFVFVSYSNVITDLWDNVDTFASIY